MSITVIGCYFRLDDYRVVPFISQQQRALIKISIFIGRRNQQKNEFCENWKRKQVVNKLIDNGKQTYGMGVNYARNVFLSFFLIQVFLFSFCFDYNIEIPLSNDNVCASSFTFHGLNTIEIFSLDCGNFIFPSKRCGRQLQFYQWTHLSESIYNDSRRNSH